MADFKEATKRLLTIDSWLMAVCALLLYFSLEVAGSRGMEYHPLGPLAEHVSIVGFIVALTLYTVAASCLCSPYYEENKDPKRSKPIKEETSMIRARRYLIIGTIILFESLAALIPQSLKFHPRALLYTILCASAPIVWLLWRSCAAFKENPKFYSK